MFGAIGLIFIALLWFFGYYWYRDNLAAISLMPDRQRGIMLRRDGRVTVSGAIYSLASSACSP